MTTLQSLALALLIASTAACGADAPASTGGASGTATQASARVSASATATPSVASSAPTAGPGDLAAPTRSEPPTGLGMAYFYWEPGVVVPGSDPLARAQAVLATARMRQLLGAGPDDGFVFSSRDDKKGMLTFQQTYAWGGRDVVVEGAYATVQLEGGDKLVYVGTGFKKGVTLGKEPLVVDEAKAGPIAEKEYEALEKARGKVTPHLAQGLRVHPIPGKGFILGYAIHVERADNGSRPYMLVVDAQVGKVVDSRTSWVE